MDRLFYIVPNSVSADAVLQPSDFKELNDFLADNAGSVIVKYEVTPDRQLALVWTSDDTDVFEAFHRKYSD